MTIEFARNVLGYTKSNSMEFDTSTEHPVISLMEEQKNVVDKRRYNASWSVEVCCEKRLKTK